MEKDFVSKLNQFMDDAIVVLKNYFSGQISVAIILGIGYAIAFKLIGLTPALILGLVIGFLTFIPLLGPFLGFLLCVGLTIHQFGEWIPFFLVLTTYIAGQLLESYYLTPKFIGKKTGLHPLQVFIAILIGGALFGILGMILAVPVALLALLAMKHFKVSEPEQKQIENKKDVDVVQ